METVLTVARDGNLHALLFAAREFGYETLALRQQAVHWRRFFRLPTGPAQAVVDAALQLRPTIEHHEMLLHLLDTCLADAYEELGNTDDASAIREATASIAMTEDQDLARRADDAEAAGDLLGAERLNRAAGEAGDPERAQQAALMALARGELGDELGRATARLAEAGEPYAHQRAGHHLAKAGHIAQAKAHFHLAVEHNDVSAYAPLIAMYRQESDTATADRLQVEAEANGDLTEPMTAAEQAGEYTRAEELAFAAVDYGVTDPLECLLWLRAAAGHPSLEAVARKAVARGCTHVVRHVADVGSGPSSVALRRLLAELDVQLTSNERP